MRKMSELKPLINNSTLYCRVKIQVLCYLQLREQLGGGRVHVWELKGVIGIGDQIYELLRRWVKWGIVRRYIQSNGLYAFTLAHNGRAYLKKIDIWYPFRADSRGRLGLPLATIREYLVLRGELVVFWLVRTSEGDITEVGSFRAPFADAKDFEYYKAPLNSYFDYEMVYDDFVRINYLFYHAKDAYSAYMKIRQLGFNVSRECLQAAIDANCGLKWLDNGR